MTFLEALWAIPLAVWWLVSLPVLVVVYGVALSCVGFYLIGGAISGNGRRASMRFTFALFGVIAVWFGPALAIFAVTSSPGPFEW